MQSWDSGGLWLKAKLFMDHASEHEHASPEFAFFASLSLECLSRSALTKIHPVLNADPRDDSNILYGCGYSFAKPRSLPAHSVYIRLEKVIDPFQKQHRELCEFLAIQRNAHIHTADLPYQNLKTGKWLARFYDTVSLLHHFLNVPLKEFLGNEGAVIADELIKTLNQEVLTAVKSKIAAHKNVFDAKPDEEKEKLRDSANTAWMFMSFIDKKSQTCPSCGVDGVLSGVRFRELPEQYLDGELYIEVEYLSSAFNCSACGLSLASIDEIAHADLPAHFTKTESTSLHELYEPEHYQEYDNM